MPNPVYARCRIGGSLYGDARWSVGLNYGSGQATDPFANLTTDLQRALETWRDNVRALNSGAVVPAAWQNALGSLGTIDTIRVARVNEQGRETAVALAQIATKISGSGTSRMPAQTAVALSLQTGRPGGSYRGRLYLPACAVGSVNGRIDPGDVAALASGTADFIVAVGGAAQDFGGAGSVRPVVVSTTRNVLTRVTQVRVGNRFDSQRRRAEGEQELYGVAAVAQ